MTLSQNLQNDFNNLSNASSCLYNNGKLLLYIITATTLIPNTNNSVYVLHVNQHIHT